MSKTITIRLDDATYNLVKTAAAAERRSIANLLEYATLRHLEECAFTDSEETAQINSDAGLLTRLKLGHKQAKQRKGHFVRGV